VSAEMSLELIPCDGVDVHMGIAVRLPPVGCCPIELVRSKKDFLTIRALGNHEFAGVVVEVEVLAAGELAGWAV
jgi:hypothetical protein